MNMVDKVVNDKYYGKVNTEKVNRSFSFFLHKLSRV